MKISVVIPVYNEVNTIAEIVRRVEAVPLDKEIIIVDDGSIDGTAEELRRLAAAGPSLRVIFKPRNEGKGAALREGFRHVTGDVVIIQDADLEYDPEDYPRLIDPIARGKADVVYGSRFLGSHRVFLFSHYLGNKILNLITNILYNCIFTDMETCYKAFRADVVRTFNLRSKSFGFEPEFTANVMRRGYRVYEVPISYDGRSYTEGKKITWRDGFVALYWLLRCRIEPMEIGTETLLRMEVVRKYNDWLFGRIAPWVGDRVLEVGAGIGNITRKLLARPYVIASDVSDKYVRMLRARFVEGDRLRIVRFDLDADDPGRFRDDRIDTVLCMNVIEHTDDDEAVLGRFREILAPGGRAVILVPACRALMSRLDANLGHRRRYSRREIRAKLERAGFAVEHLRFLNLPGAIGWFVNGRVLRRRMLPKNQMKLFDLVVPLLRLERLVPIPFGLSLLAVGKRNGGGGRTA
ncbi:MAG: glycosyltransferase [bacterium]|nr:glycosyltransferase [bacterium]